MKTALATLTFASLCVAQMAQPAPQPSPVTATQRHAPAATVRKDLPDTPHAPRVLDPVIRSNMMAKTGGLIQTPTEGPAILFLNTQKRVPDEALRSTVNQFQRMLRLHVIFTAKPSKEPVAVAVEAVSDKNTAAVIVIGDSEGYPSLLVAPESRWALINVSALNSDGLSAELLNERLQKEVWRAIGYVMGAANSNFEHCLLKPVFVPQDLDALTAKSLCPEPFGKILLTAQKLGMKSSRTSTYRKAVEEGWAPAPTNEIQRAIWQEFKK